MKKLLAVALLSAFAATPALAADAGGYVFADLGAANLSNVPGYSNPGVFGFGGGYRFSPYVAAELGISAFGDSTSVFGDRISLGSFHPAVVGILPLNYQFSLFGKLGLAFNSEHDSLYGDFSQTSTYYALGAQLNFNRQVGMRAQFESFGDFDNFSPALSATAFSLGVVFNF